ncbi:MAG: two-component system sensor histidine kinase NtrB [bacterium]
MRDFCKSDREKGRFLQQGKGWMVYRARFKSVFHGVIDIISIIDTDYTILMVNKAYEQLLKKPSVECIGQKCYALLRNRSEPCRDCPILSESKANLVDEALLISVGSERVSISRHPVYDNSGQVVGVVEIGRIITNQLRMERELQHHGRLKIMGELAASIVHEIKNPLVGIGLMAASILERMKNREVEEEMHSDVESILHEVKRLEGLLDDLMDFGKPKVFITKSEDIHEPINISLNLLKKKLSSHRITIGKSYDSTIPAIQIDTSKMQQVFLNILLNAINAMPGGGTISITTDIFREEEGQRQFARISIQDTGVGINEEYLPRIFDPFYSQSPGKTGLGLSIVTRILDLHEGFIDIRSQEGEGTTVLIYLPIDRPVDSENKA